MKTPSASKHRLAGRNLPKLDRYNGYSRQGPQDQGSGVGGIRGAGYSRKIRTVQYELELWMIVKIYSVKTTTTTFIHKSFTSNVYEFDNLWKAIKIFVLITGKQKVWNICLSLTRVRHTDRSSLPDLGDTERQTGVRNISESAEKIFTDIYNVTMSIVPVTSSDAGLITPAPQDNVSELTLLATIIFLSFLHPFVKNKGNEKK